MHYDFVVIGAGIAGASVAYELASHAQVALLERESQPGYHATGRSAAMFIETYGGPAVRALTRASRAFYTAPPAGFTEHPILSARGVMHVARIGQEKELADAFTIALQTSPSVELLSVEQTLERCPLLRNDLICGAVLESDAMDMDVHALHQGYLRGFRAHQGQLLADADLVSAVFRDGKWTIRLADGRTLTTSTLVNAAGAWADVVAQCSGVKPIGLQPKRRSAFTFDASSGTDFSAWPMVIGIDESYYFKPDAGQLLGSPANADAVEPHDVQPEELDVATGIYHIEEVSTMQIRRPKHVWAGLRSFVADGELVIGKDTDCPSFFWVAGQGGYGIQTASAASQLAASLLLDQPMPTHLSNFGVRASSLSPQRLR